MASISTFAAGRRRRDVAGLRTPRLARIAREFTTTTKLSLTRGPKATIKPWCPTPRLFTRSMNKLGGDLRFIARDASHLAAGVGLIGNTTNSNVAFGPRAVEALTGTTSDEVREVVAAEAFTFEPLRGRLTLVATDNGWWPRSFVTSTTASRRRCSTNGGAGSLRE